MKVNDKRRGMKKIITSTLFVLGTMIPEALLSQERPDTASEILQRFQVIGDVDGEEIIYSVGSLLPDKIDRIISEMVKINKPYLEEDSSDKEIIKEKRKQKTIYLIIGYTGGFNSNSVTLLADFIALYPHEVVLIFSGELLGNMIEIALEADVAISMPYTYYRISPINTQTHTIKLNRFTEDEIDKEIENVVAWANSAGVFFEKMANRITTKSNLTEEEIMNYYINGIVLSSSDAKEKGIVDLVVAPAIHRYADVTYILDK